MFIRVLIQICPFIIFTTGVIEGADVQKTYKVLFSIQAMYVILYNCAFLRM